VSQLRNTSTRRFAGLLVAAAALLVSAAACGGSDTPATGTGNPGGAGSNGFAAYAECLAKNGVTITMPSGGPRVRPSGAPSGFPGGGFPSGAPRPSGSGRPGGGFPGGGFGKPEGVDDATWQKAQQACASVLPSGRAGGNGRGGNGMSAAYRNCLQDNGVTLGQGGLATADPAVAKAVKACQALAPTASAAPAS
jgi:hypothetical protein